MRCLTDYQLQKLEKYFYKKYTYEEISVIMEEKYGFSISVRSIKRIYKEHNLRRRNIQESPIGDIIEAIFLELRDSGANLGYRALWRRLSETYKLVVKQKTVLFILNIVDPEGVEARRRHKLRRRLYNVPGPNYIFHLDGHDKLKPFGFAISACVDGFSRRMIYINVSRTNNDPKVIARYYLDAIKKCNCLPVLLRTDHGTENFIVSNLQKVLRYTHDDEFAGEKSHRFGKSTANQRIERHWSHFRRHTIDSFIALFKNMQFLNYLDVKNPFHIECLRYCFGPLITYYVKVGKKEWNQHRIRRQPFRNVVGGIPNMLYYCPEKYDGFDCRMPLDIESLELLYNEYTTDPYLVDPDFENFFKQLVPDAEIPSTSEMAYNLYMKIINIINTEFLAES